MPPWKLDRLYFSFGEWMRSSSSPKPTSTESMPRMRLNWVTIGMEPPIAISTASRAPFLRERPLAPSCTQGLSLGWLTARSPPCERKVALQSAGRRASTKARKLCADRLRILVADQPERYLGRGLGRDDGLRPLADIAADDAVHFRRRPRPDLLQRRVALFAGRDRQPDLVEEGLLVEAKRFPLRLLLGRDLAHAVIEAGDRDAAVLVVQVGEDFRQHVDRVARRAAVHARMQVVARRLDEHLLVDEVRAAWW